MLTCPILWREPRHNWRKCKLSKLSGWSVLSKTICSGVISSPPRSVSAQQFIAAPNPTAKSGRSQPVPPAILSPATPTQRVASGAVSNSAPEAVTNAVLVHEFLPIPVDGLPGKSKGNFTITTHQWLEGKLVLDLEYGAFEYTFDQNGHWTSTRGVTLSPLHSSIRLQSIGKSFRLTALRVTQRIIESSITVRHSGKANFSRALAV